MKKKRQLHCGKCGGAADFYKKGRKHRVLVCPNCGIIASNPIPLAMLAASAAPALIEAVTSKKEKGASAAQKIVTDSLDKPNKGERYVKMALGV